DLDRLHRILPVDARPARHAHPNLSLLLSSSTLELLISTNAARAARSLGVAVSHYKSNLRDIEFNLFEVLGVDQVLGTGPYEDLDLDTARSILAEIDRMAREDLAASFAESDRTPPVYDAETHSVTMPEAFKKSYHTWMDAEWFRLQLPAELGGQP